MNTYSIATPKPTWSVVLFPWIVWGVSSLFVTFQMLLQTSPSVMITDLQQAFSVDTLGVSLLSSSFFYTYMLFQIPSGMLIDRVPPRYCLTACLIGIAAMSFIFAGAHSLALAKTSRILQGIFSAPSVVPALYLAAIWFPARRFALLAGLTEMIGMMGAALGQAFLAPCVGAIGWRSTIVACALIGIALAVLTFVIVRDKPAANATGNKKSKTPVKDNVVAINATKVKTEIKIETNTEESAELKTEAQTQKPVAKTSIFRDLLTVISYPQAWISGTFCGLLFSIPAAFGSFWCIPYLQKVYPITLNVAAAASSMTLLGTALGAPAIGWASDRLGLRRLPMIISTALVLLLMIIILYVPSVSLPMMFILLFFAGFFSSAYALPFAVMRDIVPENVRGTAMGYTNLMCILIGAPILQPLIGWLLKLQMAHTTNEALAYQHALTAIPVCLALGFILSFFIKETRCGQ